MAIGDRLRQVREQNKLKLKQTAEFFNTTPQTLSRYEGGERTPGIEFVEAFCKKFAVSCDWLLLGETPIYRNERPNKSATESFLELSNVLNHCEPITTPIPEVLQHNLEKLTTDTPENYNEMIHFMMKFPKVRRNMFRYFHLIQKQYPE